MLANYTRATGTIPEGSHEDVIEILRGNNPYERDYFEGALDGNVLHGELVDIWRRPMKMERAGDGVIRFISAGKDGTFGNGDDLTSEGRSGPVLPTPSN